MRVDRKYFNKYTDLYLQLATSGEKVIVTENFTNSFELCCETSKVDPYFEIEMSYEQFMQIDDENRYEYIDGKLYLLEAHSIEHQHVLGALLQAFKPFDHFLSSRTLTGPLDVTLEADGSLNVVQPDLFVIQDHGQVDEEGHCLGVPELIVEVTSGRTRIKDMSIKVHLYEQAGVKEYWVVNPKKKSVIAHDFINREVLIYEEDEKIRSSIIEDLAIDPHEIFDLPWRQHDGIKE